MAAPLSRSGAGRRPHARTALTAGTTTLALCVWLSAATSPDAPTLSITAAELDAHVHFLASDELEGRGVGLPGNERAARYVAAALARAGVGPLVPGYRQPFAIAAATLGPDNGLTIVSDRGQQDPDIRIGADFYPLPLSATAVVEGPLVFAGYGISAPELAYDDYAGLDVAGAVVVVLRHEPEEEVAASRFDGRELSGHATFERKAEVARSHGAVGLLVIPDGLHEDSRHRLPDVQRMWPTGSTARTRHFDLAGQHEAEVSPLPVALVSPDRADRILYRSASTRSLTIDAIRDTIDETLVAVGAAGSVDSPATYRLEGQRARLGVDIVRERLELANVVGVIPGTDPVLREQHVVIGAHLDHDGIDQRRRIYNGADDNASGTAALVEVAQAMALAAKTGDGPRRSVIFAAWNAEEQGSLGSRHFVERARATSRNIVAMLNMDMVGRSEEVPQASQSRFRGLRPSSARDNANVLHLIGYSYAPDLARLVADANADIGLTLRSEYDDNVQNLLQRSDQWPFLERGIPALFFTTGLHPDYHTPDDDADKIDYPKLERVGRLVFRTAWQLVQQQPVPRFVEPTESDER